MFQIRIALIVLSLVLLLVIAVQNSDVVELQFLSFEARLSLVALVFLTSGVGFIIGFTLAKIGGARKAAGR